MNREATEQESDWQNIGLMKSLRMNLEYMRSSYKLTMNSPLPKKDNGQKAGQIIKEDIQMATAVRYNVTPPRIVRTKRPTVPIFGKHVKPLKPSCMANCAKWYGHFGKRVAFLIKLGTHLPLTQQFHSQVFTQEK